MLSDANKNENIQMLRGVSVVLVLLFHLKINALRFGYIGVDMFFVISGYLMPMILPKYTGVTFIVARLRRILPVLTICILVCLVAGYFLLIPSEYSGLSGSSLSALGFVSNIFFFFNTGYFDQDVETQPLLHTWSLGNEFVCYVLVAVLLLIFADRRNVARGALALALVSAGVFIGEMIAFQGKLNYFDPTGRMFLFFLAFWIHSVGREWRIPLRVALAVTGAATLLLALVWGPALMAQAYPDWALFVVPFICLPILLLRETVPLPAPIRRFMVWIGDLSYSIYLWHWPIITYEKVFLRNFKLNVGEMAMLSGITLVVAYASYHLIERNRRIWSWAVMAPVVGLGAAIALGGIATNGYEQRVPARLTQYATREGMQNHANVDCTGNMGGIVAHTSCAPLPAAADQVLFIGDSHSRHFIPLFKSVAPGLRAWQYPMPIEDLAPVLPQVLAGAKRAGVRRIFITYLLNEKAPADVMRVMKVLAANSAPDITVVRDIPNYEFDPVACYLRQNSKLLFRSCGYRIETGVPERAISNLDEPNWTTVLNAARTANFATIDTHRPLCAGGTCRLIVNHELIMRDMNHFNERLSLPTSRMLYRALFAAPAHARQPPAGEAGSSR